MAYSFHPARRSCLGRVYLNVNCVVGHFYEGRERTKLYGQRVKAIIGTYHFTTVVIVLEPAVWPLTNLLVAEIQIDYPSIANNCEQADAHYVSCVLVYQTLEDSRPTKMRQRS